MVGTNHLIVVNGLNKGYAPFLYAVDYRWCELKVDVVHMNNIGFEGVYYLHNFLFCFKS